MKANKMIIHSESDFAIGILVGFIIMVIVANIFPTKEYVMVTNAITECELNVPRNQHCKIIAVIDEEY
jgi:hypothetical protein